MPAGACHQSITSMRVVTGGAGMHIDKTEKLRIRMRSKGASGIIFFSTKYPDVSS